VSDGAGAARPGTVYLVGGGPGDPGLMTIRASELIACADAILYDRLIPETALAGARVDALKEFAGKGPRGDSKLQPEIEQRMVELARAGHSVVRLKGGDPFVFGRGGEEVVACREARVAVEVVPGVSSALAVPAAAGIPVTHRGTATSYLVVNGHSGLDAAARLVIRSGAATVVILMGVSVLSDLVTETLADGADPGTPVAIIENGTTAEQRVTRDRLDAIADRAAEVGVRAPAVIVIGDVAAPGLLDGHVDPGGSSEAAVGE
jgi:uroporphyrin-III C-methyltransferase/precorrin-2 dehydrogenase/sirohydrochlorin ferrochelatase